MAELPFADRGNSVQARGKMRAAKALGKTLGKTFGLNLVFVSLLTLTACTGQSQPTPTAEVMSPTVSTPAAGTTPAASPSAAATTPGPRTPVPPGSTTPTPGSANVDVTPTDVTVAGVVLSLRLDTARHMFEPAVASAVGSNPDPAASGGDQNKDKDKENVGSAVFPGGMLRVVGNFDAAQGAPADAPNAIIRHVVLTAKTKDGGQVVPYQSVSIDVLLDGRPVIFDQALVPMVMVDKDPRQLYYGNNIKLPQRGTYQVFVRLARNPLLGADQPPAAQFNLTVH
jgi:hypothetical protein